MTNQRKRMRPEVRRKQILDTAVQLFRTVGYEAASLRDLASRVGINKATIYHYFASKEEILFHIINEVGESLLSGLRRARASHEDPLEGLEAMICFQIGYMEEHLDEVKVLVEDQKSLGSSLVENTKVTQATILELYESTLTECMAKGLVRKVHLATAAFSILGHINWLYQWYKPDGALTIRQLTDEIVSILRNGLFLGEPKNDSCPSCGHELPR